MKIVLIEDEKPTANHLIRIIKSIEPDSEILSVISSVEDGLEYFGVSQDIDLIFSDIELGDGLSFDIFEQITINVPIIFCTAYNHYALNAFKTTGIDYILKPFDQKIIEKSLLKYQALKEKLTPPSQNLTELLSLLGNNTSSTSPKSVLVHQGDKIIPLNSQDIAFFYIEDTYTFAYTFEGKKHVLNQNLDVLEKTFTTFFRANRQFLINRKAVKDASQYFHRKVLINLTISFPEQIIVGKLKVTAFMEWLAST
ncbi:MAG: LytR/AlgR family response regulator transcription factor [Leadbetterella sp.]